ncbi:hypothetical protein Pint_28976 [Pistacia integerrima]|uniref:Uncharacterized protein n=1 Tax=Pistacia integerrima TaxID=434235 RepID=A0ACC0X2Q2_9ROSI|nr:hypothetical protein Pint_28976 [Pistacia integerrima]
MKSEKVIMMAFFGKFGSILRQTASGQIAGEISALKPSIYQAIRCMSSKLFVGGLPYRCDDQSLREAFSKYGHVTKATVSLHHETGRSRGFGFVTYRSKKEASSAIQALEWTGDSTCFFSMLGDDLYGRRVRVEACSPRGGCSIASGRYEFTSTSFGGGPATAYGGFDGCRWIVYRNGLVGFIGESE